MPIIEIIVSSPNKNEILVERNRLTESPLYFISVRSHPTNIKRTIDNINCIIIIILRCIVCDLCLSDEDKLLKYHETYHDTPDYHQSSR